MCCAAGTAQRGTSFRPDRDPVGRGRYRYSSRSHSAFALLRCLCPGGEVVPLSHRRIQPVRPSVPLPADAARLLQPLCEGGGPPPVGSTDACLQITLPEPRLGLDCLQDGRDHCGIRLVTVDHLLGCALRARAGWRWARRSVDGGCASRATSSFPAWGARKPGTPLTATPLRCTSRLRPHLRTRVSSRRAPDAPSATRQCA